VFKSGQANPIDQVSARLGKLGDEATVADAGGRSTNQLLDTMATLPGQTKDAAEQLIHDRQAGRGGRLVNAASDALDTQGQRLTPQLSQWVNDRATASAPIYSQLRQTEVVPSANLQSIVRTADQLGATSLGREMSAAKQMPFTLDAQNPASWNMGDLDHVKQGIDQILTSRKAMNADGTLTPLGNAYQDLKTKLVGELDKATTNPQTGESLYQSARNAYAGPSALIDAANQGRAAITKDGAAIGRITSGMSDSESQAFKLGAFEALRNKLGTQSGQTQIINMWKEPATQDKLKAIFGDELSYRSFASSVAKEARLKGLENVGRGSQTAARQFGAGELDASALADAGGAVAAAKAGHITGALAAAGKAWNSVSTPQSVRDQIGQILMSRGLLADQNLQAISPLVEQINRRNSAMAGQLGGLLGSRIGSQLATPMQYPGLLSE
jgi:gas vesicle protein